MSSIDPATGLASLPTGFRWKVSRAHGYGNYDGHLKLQKKILGLWVTVASEIITLGSGFLVRETRDVLADYEAKLARRRNRPANRKSTARYLGTYPPKRYTDE